MSQGAARDGLERPRLTPLLLVVSLLVTAVLASQAYAGVAYHRAAVERALRDFASLAGAELVRRATADVGYAGFMRVLPELVRQAEAGAAPRLAAAEAGADARLARAAGLVGRVITLSRDGTLADERGPATGPVERWVAERLSSLRGDTPFVVLNGSFAGVPRSFAFAPAASGKRVRAVGFEVDLDAVEPWLRAAAARDALLPASLGNGGVGNDVLAIRVTDQAGVERLKSGRGPWPEIEAEVRFGSAYSGVFDGWVARVSIDPAAAPALVIGGLPRSRLPLLLGLLALSTGLVLTALAQLRRERALQRLRSEFVANVSHELRTPLTQIRMFAETLRLDRVRSEQERRRALEIVDREARRLAHLVDNVLQLSRGEHGGVTLAREPQPLAPLVRQVVEEFGALAGAGVSTTLRLDDGLRAAVDAGALRQVLLNLLDNAVKYGPQRQRIEVALERAGGSARLSVTDQGPGVPAADRLRVFERFFRLEREAAAARAGAGIGLAVVRDLAERHGGRAFVEEPPAPGARFVVELPAPERSA